MKFLNIVLIFGLLPSAAMAQAIPSPSPQAQIAALQEQLQNAEGELTNVGARFIDAQQEISQLQAEITSLKGAQNGKANK